MRPSGLVLRQQVLTRTYTHTGLGLKILCSSHGLGWRREVESLLNIVILRPVADVTQGVPYCSTGTTIASGSRGSSRERPEEIAVIDEEGPIGRLGLLTHGSPEALSRWP